MPAWAWVLSVLLSLAGLFALFLACVRLRYRFYGEGEWTGRTDSSRARGTVRVEFVLPGFRRTWEPLKQAPDESADASRPPFAETHGRDETAAARAAAAARAESPASRPERRAERDDPRKSSRPAPDAPPPGTSKGDPRETTADRRVRALFLFATDPLVWRALRRFGLRAAILTFRLFDPRLEAAVGHPDPALLGRAAGRWHAVRPLLPTRRAEVGFRFQDRHPSLRIRLEGGLSALSLAFFGVRLLWAFPAVRMGRRAWRHWRRPHLSGWRARVYRRVRERG